MLESDKVQQYDSELSEMRHEMDALEDQIIQATRQLEEYEEKLVAKDREKEKLASTHIDLRLQLQETNAQCTAVKERYRDVRRNVGKLQRVVVDANMGKRPLTPRPDWAPLKFLTGDRMNLDQPSGLVVTELIDCIESMNADLQDVQSELPWVQEEKERQQQMANKWFVCLGTGPQVPKFLRVQGKVRNRCMQKADCEEFINSFWDARTKAVARLGREAMMSPADYLFQHLKNKFGVNTAVAEFAYNLMDAVKRYAYDADCELFHKVIMGECCEEVYADQNSIIDGLMIAFRKAEQRAGIKSKQKGVLQRDLFLQVVQKYFPFKSADDMRALQSALAYDQPMGAVKYSILFDSAKNGDQGKFAETVRDQHLVEVLSAYPAIEESISAHTLSESTSASNHNEGVPLVTSIKLIREGLLKYDKGIPESEVLRILATGLNVTQEEAKTASMFRKVDVATFCKRLRAIVIRRFSLPPEETEERKQFKALRSLMPHERRLLESVFAEMDTEYSGTLGIDGISKVLQKVYSRGDQEGNKIELDMEQMFRIFDADGSGDVSLDEFLRGVVCAPELQFIGTIFTWREVFTRFDADQSGTVDHQELEEMMDELMGKHDGSEEEQTRRDEILARFAAVEDEGLLKWPQFLKVMEDINGLDTSAHRQKALPKHKSQKLYRVQSEEETHFLSEHLVRREKGSP